MTESTLTLSQSGLLGLMLEHHRWKAYQAARRRIYLKRVGAAFRNSFTWSRSAPTAPPPAADSAPSSPLVVAAANLSLISQLSAPGLPLPAPVSVSRQIHTYPELQEQIHRDLRIQHPEWIGPNGECPMCDVYEARLTQLLDTYAETQSDESIAEVHRTLEKAANGLAAV